MRGDGLGIQIEVLFRESQRWGSLRHDLVRGPEGRGIHRIYASGQSCHLLCLADPPPHPDSESDLTSGEKL